MIPLSVPEVRKLLLRLVWYRLMPPDDAVEWSMWRRAHQYAARASHYKKRKAIPPDD